MVYIEGFVKLYLWNVFQEAPLCKIKCLLEFYLKNGRLAEFVENFKYQNRYALSNFFDI